MGRSLIALDASKAFAAVTDGPELLVWSQTTGDPCFQQFCDENLVGIAFVGQHLLTLDDTGELAWRNLTDGAKEQISSLQKTALALTAFDAENVVASLVDGLWFSGAGQPIFVPIEGVTCLSYGPKGTRLAVGCHGGDIHLFDAASGSSLLSTHIEEAIIGVHCARDGFVVATKTRLLFLNSELETVAQSTLSKPIHTLAVCQATGLVAVALANDTIEIVSSHDHTRLGTIEYPSRRVDSVTFGDGGVLGVGVEDGDVNWFNLLSGTHHQGAPHSGRALSNWHVNRNFQATKIRGHLARVKTAGSAIAVAQTIADSETATKNGRKLWLLIALVVVFVFVCAGCCGLGGGLYYFYSGT